MIIQADADKIEQRCGGCGAQRRIALASLVAGIEIGDPPEPADPNIIALPVCPHCGATEFLNRVTSAPMGGVDDAAQHRRAVNAVHAALVAATRVPPSLREYFAAEAVEIEQASLPWSFTGELAPIPDALDPAARAFAEFLAGRSQGGA